MANKKENTWQDNLKTVALFGIPLVATAFGAYYLVKKAIQQNQYDNTNRDTLELYSPAQIATQIRQAFENDNYPGTNEDLLLDAFNKMPSKSFYQRVITAYRSLFESSFWHQLSNDLPKDLQTELDSEEYGKVLQIINNKPLN